MSDIIVAPSILAADFANLGSEVRAIDEAGCDWVHLDVMDGHFVPNISFGPAIITALRPHTSKTFDVHLMIAPCDPYLEAFADAGADIITVHAEAGPHLHRSLMAIKDLGKRAGVSLNPGTPASVLTDVLDLVDLILVMTVNPGFGGQSFLSSQLKKIETLREMTEGSDIIIEVDGGIGETNTKDVVSAGATALVAGSSIFSQGSYDNPAGYAKAIQGIRSAAVTA